MKQIILGLILVCAGVGSAQAQQEGCGKWIDIANYDHMGFVYPYGKKISDAKKTTQKTRPTIDIEYYQIAKGFERNEDGIVKATLLDSDGVMVCNIENVSLIQNGPHSENIACGEFVLTVFWTTEGWCGVSDRYVFRLYQPGEKVAYAQAQKDMISINYKHPTHREQDFILLKENGYIHK